MSRATVEFLPSTREIRDTVAEEIVALGGELSEVLDDGELLYLRAILSMDAEIRTGDAIKAGVAVRASCTEILVYPYVYRLVCRNGAIVAHALDLDRIERIRWTEVYAPSYDVAATLARIAASVRAFAASDVFDMNAHAIRSLINREPEFISTVSRLRGLSIGDGPDLLRLIMDRFVTGRDRTAFGFMNAITSVARDTTDPETRWMLEEMGGSFITRQLRKPRPAPANSREEGGVVAEH